uniref:MmcQ/YjbR family DNA-binding protein n=1 Tax=Steinernema glaseri TaxID=37863 RepID=A0A1I7ZRC2_9BILA
MISLADPPRPRYPIFPHPFLELSGQWGRVAGKLKEKEGIWLHFKTLAPASDDVVFAFGENSVWEAFKNGEASEYFANEIMLSRPGIPLDSRPIYYPLDAENADLLRRYLRRST